MKKRKTLTLKLLMGIVLILAIMFFAVLFINKYNKLGDTIENERITYVSGLKDQIVQNINAEKRQQLELVDIYKKTLSVLQPDNFAEVKKALGSETDNEAETIFLMDDKGQIYDLNGNPNFFSDSELGRVLVVSKASVFSYAQIKTGKEFWVCGSPMEKLIIDGIDIYAVLSAIRLEDFEKRMSINISGNSYSSYITRKNGNIVISPPENNLGFNLLSTLENFKLDKDTLEEIKKDFEEGKANQKFFTYNNNRWLFDYSTNIYEDWVVAILMPMTITAADTYAIMKSILISVMLLLVSIVFFLIFILVLYYSYEQRRNQAVQREKAKMETTRKVAETKNQFLAKMSHDIRTPLNAVIGLIQITMDQNCEIPKVAGNMAKAKTSAEYLLSILNDILDMSKIDSGKMIINLMPVSIASLFSELKLLNEIQISKKDIEFDVWTEGNLAPGYMLDKLRINQILMNLISNAIKFTPTGGKISLSVMAEAAEGDKDKLTFMIEDNGIGMSEEFCNNMFQPFVQEDAKVAMNYGGSGLGLAIVRNLVELMHGEIDVKSKKEEGTCFRVVIWSERCVLPDQEIQESLFSNEEAVLSGKTVLLAEDIDINAEIAVEIFTNYFGMRVDVAENGRIALDKFINSKAGTYDVVFMDIQMPVMNGLEAAKKIRECSHNQAKTIPIFAMSANAYDDDIEKSITCGMNEHLSKPVNIEEIEKALKKYLK